jgi:putative hydrolase of HD superfamily
MEIEGTKVILRDWKLSDVETFGYWQIGDHEWKAWDGPYYQSTDEEILKSLEDLKHKISSGPLPEIRTKLVIADLKTDKFIGTVNSYWISKETNWLAAGIVIFDPGFWGGGIGREALSLWINNLFRSRPEIVRLDLQTWSGNERMMGLATKLGFQLEGRFRNARIVKGKLYDSIQFGILREEWEQRLSHH